MDETIDKLMELSATHTEEAWMAAAKVAIKENVGAEELADYIDRSTDDEELKAGLFDWSLGLIGAKEEYRRRYGPEHRPEGDVGRGSQTL